MYKSHFSLVADDLVHIAERAYKHLEAQGYRVAPEKRAVDYPRVPSIIAKMGHSTLIVEVASSLDEGIASEWVGYAQSCNSDTQFAFALPVPPPILPENLRFAVSKKIGLIAFEDGGQVVELAASVDLAMRVTLPPLNSFSSKSRTALAPAYQKWERGDWRGGFLAACQALEQHSVRYLKSRITKPGVSVLSNHGNPLKLTPAMIDRATLGQLGKYFEGITTPNSLDSQLAKTLPIVNPERIGAVHKNHSAAVEARLRKVAGKRMYAIINCLKSLAEG